MTEDLKNEIPSIDIRIDKAVSGTTKETNDPKGHSGVVLSESGY
jgi:hypothetical protein